MNDGIGLGVPDFSVPSHISEVFGRGAETWEPVSPQVGPRPFLDAASEASSGHRGADRPECGEDGETLAPG